MTRKICLLLLVLAAAGLVGGCAPGGFIGPRPVVTDPMGASNVTFYRDGSWVGLFGPVIVRLDGREVLRLWRNQSFSLRLDPDEYVLEFSIGFNECRRALRIAPGRSYRLQLVPNCMVRESFD